MEIRCVRGVSQCVHGMYYCGRKCGWFEGSALGNPFNMGSESQRIRVIEQYRVWLWGKIQGRDATVLGELRVASRAKSLGCWCVGGEGEKVWDSKKYPGYKLCHAQVIVAAIAWIESHGLNKVVSEQWWYAGR